MANDDILRSYPTGQFALGKGELVQITSFEWDFTNNAKAVATLREKMSGVTTGSQPVTGSFEIVVPAEGPERDYFQLVESGSPQQGTVKIPGVTKALRLVISKIRGSITIEDGVKMTAEYVGKWVKLS